MTNLVLLPRLVRWSCSVCRRPRGQDRGYFPCIQNPAWGVVPRAGRGGRAKPTVAMDTPWQQAK